MARSRGRQFQRSGARRSTSWETGPDLVDGGFTVSASALWTTVAAPVTDGLTVIRTRGFFRAILGAAGAIGDGFFGAVGFGITTDEAIAIGITALPTPLSNEAWDGWFYHRYFDVRAVTATIADGVNAAAAAVEFEIDSKAMRKLPLGMTMFAVTQVVESGTAVLEVQGSSRVLVKNP